ncbi:MAG: VWA domain-containing protein [Planctomycetota bacterium]
MSADAEPPSNTEEYDAIQENPFQTVLESPLSTFGLDVDTASYANVRRLLSQGTLPPPGAVRLEELVNYFRYDYPEPAGDHPLSVTTECSACPWQPEHQLLRVGVRAKDIEFESRRSSNIVFLLDVSGSMMRPNKLPLVKQALKLLIEKLSPEDHVAIVVYAGSSGLVLDSTRIAEASTILEAVENLQAGGSTNGGQGIELAYRVAQDHFVDGGINRVVLCTDGDFNVGVSDRSSLVDLIESKAKSGVYLTVLGFGDGNLKDSTMETLADKGNGNYAYIDSVLEARKVLVEEVGGTLVTVAKDVKIQLDFNPMHVQEYRLLGYENRLLNNRDFRDDSKDAGEVGAGHQVTAFYELVPTDAARGTQQSDERSSEFVAAGAAPGASSATKLTVNLRYQDPDSSEAHEFQVRVSDSEGLASPSSDFQFATSVLAYGMMLRGSEYVVGADWDWVVETAELNRGDDPRGLRAEFVALAKTAKRLFSPASLASE